MTPIPERSEAGFTTYDAKEPETKFPPIEPLRPPKGAPNVLIVLLDDVGFAASRPFGGPIHTPVAERLAGGGLRYTRFHTTALCSPTRQALLTGRSHHTVNMACVTGLATSIPGYTSIRPASCAPLAEVLKLNGYSTAQFGKCHEVPVWETSSMGPFRQWPTSSGFEYFYGFVCGETNQYYPSIDEGTIPVEPSKTPEHGYHFTEDMTDKAIAWVHKQKALMPDKPFFMYFAPGATHAPHHVPKAWADKYKGKFDQGWDRLREEIFARQKELGIVPPTAELTERPPASGVIVAQGGQFGGWSLYAKDGCLKCCYNLFDLQRFYAQASHAIPSGKHQVRMEFAYDGGGFRKGGNVMLFLDGERIGEGRVAVTQPMLFSADETCDVARENGSPVCDDYAVRKNEFSGKINWVQLDEGADDQDHLITSDGRLRVAMARQ